ncbi:DUF5389 domain-containing protein [Actinobacillus equuli subsp. haemolyticus]|uniref:DUF5389 domain-containing protein n=1 Tax=Actinobacillus equuli subsp. equuli TaxID=202947 RepID=A0A9X4JDA4_ACTEU|nr:DUF5389 family protein [Actinobacillus equuli]MDE8035771.1 DUF5389 domain-containing protein [Actinobacillus equuli subsp. equuli]MDG4947214.1 DUF5389 domain-containing protein [Actinobacillus equuli subsp. haemolyticus]WGE42017.1 DUF5389 domain-containing protein [Actinobacillus equuli subsp. haemolyticus]WGE46372.1 DUF5389 domain-containing protein [Actinobacillus equuli subsp. haemolyticus]WGE50569.1 DUF5389 domain-containing protein [Actinobacillus equuli subsp. haemolyticus]
MQKSSSKFNWALAFFCLPCALWPLALLISPKFSSLALTPTQINWFSTAFWVYPLVLFVIALILYKLHQSKKALARGLLMFSLIVFYVCLGYIIQSL